MPRRLLAALAATAGALVCVSEVALAQAEPQLVPKEIKDGGIVFVLGLAIWKVGGPLLVYVRALIDERRQGLVEQVKELQGLLDEERKAHERTRSEMFGMQSAATERWVKFARDSEEAKDLIRSECARQVEHARQEAERYMSQMIELLGEQARSRRELTAQTEALGGRRDDETKRGPSG